MRILPASTEGIEAALAVLARGETVMHATETCYGFACDLTNPEAVARLFKIKQRSPDQPVSALFSSIEEAKKYVEWNDRAEKLAQEFLPGRLMIILRLKSDVPYFLFPTPNSPSTIHHPPSPTLGIRVSSHPLAMELVTRFGRPISTTSANIHAKPAPYSVAEILAQYKNAAGKPDLILDSGTLPFRKPSRIIDCSGSSETILRS
ncbi:threonylcarbamoyl-AMP synthase [Candidatus Peribacteria bacterium RIFCSPHIGHO2_01_FULL_55_13]|nr:MAG: threonylcarbamoyl-AMP synthase [Candidatus Peribacteria bacterium RIFCSPHIGHO2_01_FULL_55_13]